MALTATQLRSYLKSALYKDTTYTDPTDLDVLLTMGQDRIVRESPHTLGAKQGTITTANGTQEYSLASDFFQVRSMWLASTSEQLKPMSHDRWTMAVESLSTIPSGSPEWYIVYGFHASDAVWKARLFHTPDGIYSVKYFYYWMPAAISGSTTPAICTIGFSELLLEAAIMIARGRNDPEGRVDSTQQYRILMRDYMAYNPQGPDYTPQLASHYGEGRRGATVRLPPEYPDL